MSEETLLLCPWCGPGTEIKVFLHGQHVGDPDAFCQCQNCTSTGPSRETKELAIDAWNRRSCTTPGAAAEMVPDSAWQQAVMELTEIGYGKAFKHLIIERAKQIAASAAPAAPAPQEVDERAELAEFNAWFIPEAKICKVKDEDYAPMLYAWQARAALGKKGSA